MEEKKSWLSQENEEERLAALMIYKTVSSPSDHELEDFLQLACDIFEFNTCLITLVGKNKIYFKASTNLTNVKYVDRKGLVFGQLINEIAIIDSIDQTSQISEILSQKINFCVGTPLITPDGYNIGSLWILTDQLIAFGSKKLALLQKFNQVLMERMTLWISLTSNASIKLQNSKLVVENEGFRQKIAEQLEYQNEICSANNVLEEVLESYEFIFKKAPIAMGICSGLDKHIWQANQAMINTFGEANLIGKPLNQLILSINGEDFLSVLEKVFEQSTPYHSKESKLEIVHGSINKHIFATVSLQPVGRMGDESENIMFIIDELTEQVFSRQVTEEANSILLRAIEDTDMGYTIVEFASGKMTSNAKLKQNYGYLPDEEFNYKDLFNVMLPKYRTLIKNLVEKAIINKSIYQSEYEVKWRDGSIHWIRGYGKPMYDANGNATHIIGMNKIILKKFE